MTNIIIFTGARKRRPDYRDADVALSGEAYAILRRFITMDMPDNICPRRMIDIEADVWMATYCDQDNHMDKWDLGGNDQCDFAPHCAMTGVNIECSYISERPIR